MAEMVQQPVEVPVPLQLFGGLVTEMSPSDLPEGISPDCQDIVFFPGGISSRPAAQKWLSGLLTAGTTVTYQKTFVTPWGATKNLFLLSNGQLYVQDSATPNILTLMDTLVPGSYASSVSAFGKEYIVFHNNITGTDIPRIYDGSHLDRATQCGPGAPPTVASTILASTTMAASGAAPTTPITSITPSDLTRVGAPPGFYSYYASILLVVGSTAGITVGSRVTVAGNTNGDFNINWGVTQIISATQFKCGANLNPGEGGGTGGTLTIGANATAIRNNNIVSVTANANHNLQVGFQVQISNLPNQVVGGTISSIVIDNELNLGLATFTMTQPHGLLPENVISVLGVPNTAVGGAITGASVAGQIATITTTTAHGLVAGTSVLIAGVTSAIFDGQFVILTVPSTTTFTYSLIEADATSTAGTVSLVWPVSNTSILPNFFTVVSTPTPTTFTVQINYTDGTWAGGTVTFEWNGTFYVTAVLSATSFQYQQYGPNATTSTAGTITPFSQIAPGIRSCVVMFQTRQGLITAPSPPVQLITNGGQYLTISNIPIGPPDTIARIIAFTGADGANFFYIPNPGFVNGITVSTSTQVNDNVTTSILVDFSDLTLFDSTAIDIPGNNLFELGVLGPCLGVSSFASRAAWFGMKNDISNLLNLGFEGGYLSGVLTQPLGWTVSGVGGLLINTSYGMGWQVSGGGAGTWGEVNQPCYRDINNVPILLPNTEYTTNIKITRTSNGGGTGQVQVLIYSPSIGSVSSSIIHINTMPLNTPGFYQFELPILPVSLPSDIIIRVIPAGLSFGDVIVIDDIEVYPTLQPEVTEFLWSYVNLPDSLDLESGFLGATDDDTAIQCSFTYRGTFLFLTEFGLHETSDLAGYEPDGWVIREVSRNCGACGPKAITTGENFSAWVTSPSTQPPVGRGLYLYTGGAVYKLSQEIQPDFDSVNPAAQQCIWVTNDAINRRMYLGLPLGTATAPNDIHVLDYREMDTAAEIASKSPIHISFTGKMICSDLSRKWTRWTLSANCGEIMTIPGVGVQFSIGAGNGEAPGVSSGFADCYWFNPAKFTDDDYGQITPYYTTYFFINHELEQALQVGAHRKLYKRYAIFIQGLGYVTISPFGNILTNPWPPTQALSLSSNQTYDLGDGLNVIAERCAFKISTYPIPGQSDNWFSLGKFIVTMMQEPVAPIRFGAV